LTLKTDENIPKYLIGDPIRIYRIVLELLVNSLKFTENGHIHIYAKLAKKENDDVVVKIFVEDTGIGIPLEKQQDLYVRFKRLTPSYEGIYKGVGLGLSIIKEFLDDLNGEIYVESHLGKGTKFVCIIPVKELLLEEEDPFDNSSPLLDMNTTPELYQHSAKNKLATKKYGLIVEDQSISALVAKTLLIEQGCEIDVAENGKTAIEQAKNNQYDFILMDIGLPDVNGYEVTREIRSFEATSKHKNFIIGLTGHVDVKKKEQAIDAGMNIILSKPLTQEMSVNFLKNLPETDKK